MGKDGAPTEEKCVPCRPPPPPPRAPSGSCLPTSPPLCLAMRSVSVLGSWVKPRGTRYGIRKVQESTQVSSTDLTAIGTRECGGARRRWRWWARARLARLPQPSPGRAQLGRYDLESRINFAVFPSCQGGASIPCASAPAPPVGFEASPLPGARSGCDATSGDLPSASLTPRPPCARRPAQQHHCGRGRRTQAGPVAGVQGVPDPGEEERPGDGRDARQARPVLLLLLYRDYHML